MRNPFFSSIQPCKAFQWILSLVSLKLTHSQQNSLTVNLLSILLVKKVIEGVLHYVKTICLRRLFHFG